MAPKKVKTQGKTFKISESDRKNKQLKATQLPGGKTIHFGDPDMKEFPGTDRGDNYCARSYGLGKMHDILGDTSSPNFWSRNYLWNCVNKKSKSSKQKAGLKIL